MKKLMRLTPRREGELPVVDLMMVFVVLVVFVATILPL